MKDKEFNISEIRKSSGWLLSFFQPSTTSETPGEFQSTNCHQRDSYVISAQLFKIIRLSKLPKLIGIQ